MADEPEDRTTEHELAASDEDGGYVDEGEAAVDSLLGAGLDMEQLLGAAMDMQAQLLAAQEAAAAQVVTGSAGGGVVQIDVTGTMEFRAVRIRPDVIDPDDPDLLCDLVLAALRDAVAQASAAARPSLDLGGMADGLPGLGALFGSSEGDDADDPESGSDDPDDAG